MADYFSKVISGTTRPVATTLSAQKLSGATSFTVTAATGWDTGTPVHGIMYRTDAGTGAKVPGSQIDWKGTVSGTTVSGVTITAGTDDTYAIGTTVELAPTAAWGDDMATGILVEHNQDGTHGAVTATSVSTDTITEETAAAGVTIDGVLLKDSKIATAGAVDNTSVITGMPVQMASSSYSAVATGTATIPLDDTIPQNTEGTEFMTLSITPKSTTNILVIRVVAFLSHNQTGADMVGAIFQDSTANALAAISSTKPTADYRNLIVLEHSMVAGTTSATTFKFRAGGHIAGTYTFNGAASNRYFGAITKSAMTITEYKAS